MCIQFNFYTIRELSLFIYRICYCIKKCLSLSFCYYLYNMLVFVVWLCSMLSVNKNNKNIKKWLLNSSLILLNSKWASFHALTCLFRTTISESCSVTFLSNLLLWVLLLVLLLSVYVLVSKCRFNYPPTFGRYFSIYGRSIG